MTKNIQEDSIKIKLENYDLQLTRKDAEIIYKVLDMYFGGKDYWPSYKQGIKEK